MDLSPEQKKQSQDGGAHQGPDDDLNHHRVEAKAYAFLTLWIFSDFLVIFGHFAIAAWFFYLVLVGGLGLFTHHAIKGWAPRKKGITRCYVGLCLILPFLLFFLSRTAKPSYAIVVTSTNAVDWLPPKLPDGYKNVYLIFGGNSSEMTPEEIKRSSFMDVNGFVPIKWRIESDRLYADVDIPFEDRIITIRGGKISSDMPAQWEMNRNSNAVEIVTANGNPIYQVFYRRPDEVVVNGIFANRNVLFAATTNGMEYWTGRSNVLNVLRDFYSGVKPTGIPRIFKYPAWKHSGEYADDPPQVSAQPQKLSITVSPAINRNMLFQAGYNLRNEGTSDIYDVLCHMAWRPDPYNQGDPLFFDKSTNPMPYLSPGQTHNFWFAHFPQMNPPVGAFIQIDVVYRPVSFSTNKTTNTFGFLARKSQNGDYEIVPFDDPDMMVYPGMKRIAWDDILTNYTPPGWEISTNK